ncbi:FAST kinase domain-containing protein 1, mitochondrial-like [Hyperolius riggenbachi]|uniref:FAST kinase domain-containing protein 1, mitochondrial-like n=1 Tax=Hyperolius riggenbachi TaxID=752182 RepID=UPI0035A3A732
MFRCSAAVRLSLRLLHTRTARTDLLLEQLKKSRSEYHVFQLVGMNRPVLTIDHVTCAMNLLWELHNVNPKELTTAHLIRDHPEFLALCTVAENNIDFMGDCQLVDILYLLDRFHIHAHCSLVQQLVVEGWRRLQRLDLPALASFAAYLKKQNMTTSPLMGQIASVVVLYVDEVEDPVMLSSLADSLYAVSSPSLKQKLIEKTEATLDKLDVSHLGNALNLIEGFQKDRYDYVSLLGKCDKLFQKHTSSLDPQTICRIVRVFHQLDFNNSELLVGAKAKLLDEVELCEHPGFFAELFVVLHPIVAQDTRKGLENKLLSLRQDMSVSNLCDVLKTLAYTGCKNTALIQGVCKQLLNKLVVCTPKELYTFSESIVSLGYQHDSLWETLQRHLKRCIISSFIPAHVVLMIRAFALLGHRQIDLAILSKLDDVTAQCSLRDLNHMATVVLQLLENAHGAPRRSGQSLLEKLNTCRLKMVQEAECIDSLLQELSIKDVAFQMDDILLENTLSTCQRLEHQLTSRNVAEFCKFVLRTDTLIPSVMDRIAALIIENITKIYPSSVYLVLRTFAVLNYEPPQGRELYNVCTQHVLNNLDSLSPHFVVLTANTLSMAGCFPEELIKAIFNIHFLRRFEAKLEVYDLKEPLRYSLLKLNRAVCIERPEYGIPWFHEDYSQRRPRGLEKRNLRYQQMFLLLQEILGGSNYIKSFASTSYHYLIEFEYTLNKDGKPIAYVEPDFHSVGSSQMCRSDDQFMENKPLPAGAERYVVIFLSCTEFCRNSTHLKGYLAVKKRHLEMLGYHVIEIPHYEWYSDTLGTKDAWTNYLRKKIFADNVCSS